MPEPFALLPRRAEPLVAEALEDTRVVFVNGARQVGKSTLTRLATGRRPAVVRLLDDPPTLRAAKDDPTGFVEHDRLMLIDEIQLVPELLAPIKVAVDLDPIPGRYLLTGSSRILPGRVARRSGRVRGRRFPARSRVSTIHPTCAAATIWSGSAPSNRFSGLLPVDPDRTRRPGTDQYRAPR
ncbi:AAA family ATPase [Actinophytocola sediminis]